MQKKIIKIAICFILSHSSFFCVAKPSKIVALVPGHNDSRFLPNCFRALAIYADAIVYLDDASTDDSVQIAELLANECHIEQIIVKKEWIRNASADRQKLLDAGRKAGGTHFITLDADEMFTANCAIDNKLRNHILALKPGEQLVLSWIQLWRSIDQYRYDNSVWTNNYKCFAFCDDGVCSHADRFLNESRTPDTLQGMRWFIEGYEYGVLHFQFVNFENLLRKQAWYRCMERVYNPKRTIVSINDEYRPSKDENNLGTLPAPKNWLEGYNFFDRTVVELNELWREQEVMHWFLTYGLSRFAGLDIWDTHWPFDAYINKNESFLGLFVFQKKENGTFLEIGTPEDDQKNPLLFLTKARNWNGYSVGNSKADHYTHKVKNVDILLPMMQQVTKKIAVCLVADGSTIHLYNTVVKEKVSAELERLKELYFMKEVDEYTFSEVDLIVINELVDNVNLTHCNLEGVQAICVAKKGMNDALKKVIEGKQFALIGYEDDYYLYFVKIVNNF